MSYIDENIAEIMEPTELNSIKHCLNRHISIVEIKRQNTHYAQIF